MEYVEILRARRTLLWYTGILLSCLIVSVVSIYSAAHGDVSDGNHAGHVRLSDILTGCAFGAFLVATLVSPGLSAEAATTPIAWTRPLRREVIAWRYVVVDAAAIVIGFAASLVVVVLFFASFGAVEMLAVDAGVPLSVGLGLGCAAMWYGLILLASARTPGRGGLIAGLSWAVFVAIGGLYAAPLPPLFHGVAIALNYLNPFAWFGDTAIGSMHRHGHEIMPLPGYVRALGAWVIAAVATFAAVRLWASREV